MQQTATVWIHYVPIHDIHYLGRGNIFLIKICLFRELPNFGVKDNGILFLSASVTMEYVHRPWEPYPRKICLFPISQVIGNNWIPMGQIWRSAGFRVYRHYSLNLQKGRSQKFYSHHFRNLTIQGHIKTDLIPFWIYF